MIEQPKRIQRKRTKGWRMPDNTVYVGRPTLFGNPWRVDSKGQPWVSHALSDRRGDCKLPKMRMTRFGMQARYRAWLDGSLERWDYVAMIPCQVWRQMVLNSLHELRGKNLACWCPLDQACHADVLLELANTL